MTRRVWVTGLLLVACMVLVPFTGSAQAPKPNEELTKLADDVCVFRHRAHKALVIATPEGVIVTDPISQEAAT